MKGQRDAAKGLLTKARHDLIAAEAVAATGEALDAVAFHAQQAIEKSLKALLVLQAVEYPLIHDLDRLLRMCLPYYPDLGEYEAELPAFEPYAVVGRYDELTYPTPDETDQMVGLAKRMYQYAAAVVIEPEEPGDE